MIDLTGRTALVTGGSRGVGKATCLLLAGAGANVVLGYHQNHAAAKAILEELRTAGRSAICVSGDVSRREDVERLFACGREAFGTVDIVVGNAGIWKRAPIDQMQQSEWRETLETNLSSIFYTCQLATLEMKARRSGRIILVSSTAGQRGEPCYSHYAATKGAIISFAKSLASELGPWNIRVNVVAPGWVDTDMSAETLRNPARRKSIEKMIPLGQIATAKEIAGPILFLASELSNHVHGEVLNVNGGSVLCG